MDGGAVEAEQLERVHQAAGHRGCKTPVGRARRRCTGSGRTGRRCNGSSLGRLRLLPGRTGRGGLRKSGGRQRGVEDPGLAALPSGCECGQGRLLQQDGRLPMQPVSSAASPVPLPLVHLRAVLA